MRFNNPIEVAEELYNRAVEPDMSTYERGIIAQRAIQESKQLWKQQKEQNNE